MTDHIKIWLKRTAFFMQYGEALSWFHRHARGLILLGIRSCRPDGMSISPEPNDPYQTGQHVSLVLYMIHYRAKQTTQILVFKSGPEFCNLCLRRINFKYGLTDFYYERNDLNSLALVSSESPTFPAQTVSSARKFDRDPIHTLGTWRAK